MTEAPPKQTVTGTESVHMDASAGLPPFSGSFHEAPRDFPDDGFSASSALVSMHDAASQSGGDAFPVLKAFQDYLESERVRSRRRIVLLSCIFAGVVFFVAAGFVLIWLSYARNMERTQQTLLKAALEKDSGASSAALVNEAVSRARAEQSADFTKTLETVNATVTAVQKDNADLKASLKANEEALKASQDALAAMKAQLEAEKKALAEAQAAAEAAKAKANADIAKAKAAADAKRAEPVAATPPPSSTASAAATPSAQGDPAPPAVAAASPANPVEPEVPTRPAPAAPDGFIRQDISLKAGKEPNPVKWNVFVPVR